MIGRKDKPGPEWMPLSGTGARGVEGRKGKGPGSSALSKPFETYIYEKIQMCMLTRGAEISVRRTSLNWTTYQ